LLAEVDVDLDHVIKQDGLLIRAVDV